MLQRIACLLLPAGLMLACAKPPVPVEIAFSATISGTPIACESDNRVQLTDLRFYVHDLRLLGAGGESQAVELPDDGAWQHAGLALLDLENGTGACSNGTPAIHSVIVGTVPRGDYRGLTFTLGVPFEHNHRDPLLAAAPLDDAAMHWHWRGGYKFLRAGVRTANDGFWVHLGSTGCKGTIQNISACAAPNRVNVRLDDFVPGRDIIAIDLGALLAAGELDDGVRTDCSSGPAEAHCAAAFLALGLDHLRGTASSAQRVFASRPSP